MMTSPTASKNQTSTTQSNPKTKTMTKVPVLTTTKNSETSDNSANSNTPSITVPQWSPAEVAAALERSRRVKEDPLFRYMPVVFAFIIIGFSYHLGGSSASPLGNGIVLFCQNPIGCMKKIVEKIGEKCGRIIEWIERMWEKKEEISSVIQKKLSDTMDEVRQQHGLVMVTKVIIHRLIYEPIVENMITMKQTTESDSTSTGDSNNGNPPPSFSTKVRNFFYDIFGVEESLYRRLSLSSTLWLQRKLALMSNSIILWPILETNVVWMKAYSTDSNLDSERLHPVRIHALSPSTVTSKSADPIPFPFLPPFDLGRHVADLPYSNSNSGQSMGQTQFSNNLIQLYDYPYLLRESEKRGVGLGELIKTVEQEGGVGIFQTSRDQNDSDTTKSNVNQTQSLSGSEDLKGSKSIKKSSKFTHNLLLNKYSVVPNHLLISPKKFEHQIETPITPEDLQATDSVTRVLDAISFINVGRFATQPHKHFQVFLKDELKVPHKVDITNGTGILNDTDKFIANNYEQNPSPYNSKFSGNESESDSSFGVVPLIDYWNYCGIPEAITQESDKLTSSVTNKTNTNSNSVTNQYQVFSKYQHLLTLPNSTSNIGKSDSDKNKTLVNLLYNYSANQDQQYISVSSPPSCPFYFRRVPYWNSFPQTLSYKLKSKKLQQTIRETAIICGKVQQQDYLGKAEQDGKWWTKTDYLSESQDESEGDTSQAENQKVASVTAQNFTYNNAQFEFNVIWNHEFAIVIPRSGMDTYVVTPQEVEEHIIKRSQDQRLDAKSSEFQCNGSSKCKSESQSSLQESYSKNDDDDFKSESLDTTLASSNSDNESKSKSNSETKIQGVVYQNALHFFGPIVSYGLDPFEAVRDQLHGTSIRRLYSKSQGVDFEGIQ